MPRGNHTIPLKDAEKAISIIRNNAELWNIISENIGVVGSFAGGHLATSLCTLAPKENTPDFAILYYPVISFEGKHAHQGSKIHLLGNEVNSQEDD